jgi:hypothetical protein
MLWVDLPKDLGKARIHLPLTPKSTANRAVIVVVMLASAAAAVAWWHAEDPRPMMVSRISVALVVLLAGVLIAETLRLRNITGWSDFALTATQGGELTFPKVGSLGRELCSWPLAQTSFDIVQGRLVLRRADGAHALVSSRWLPAGWGAWMVRAGIRRMETGDLLLIDAFGAFPHPVSDEVHALLLTEGGKRRVIAVGTSKDELIALMRPAEKVELASYQPRTAAMAVVHL